MIPVAGAFFTLERGVCLEVCFFFYPALAGSIIFFGLDITSKSVS